MSGSIPELHRSFNDYLVRQYFDGNPIELYEPFGYMISLGGKRTRPLLVLMAYELFGKNPSDVFPQAYAIELFHNFTLIHDDIMDNAALRRGAQTVHTKFGLPSAILSGDAMLVYAYRYLAENRSSDLPGLLSLFNRMAIGVCEGQQLDLVFESRNDVTPEEYIRMIELKTALLLGTALRMGAYLAGAGESDASALYEFGINTGIAFQLSDDLLDTFGDDQRVGKTSGGDIIRNKKTILYLEALRQANASQRNQLTQLYTNDVAPEEKVTRVKQLFAETNALETTRGLVAEYHRKALVCLDAVTAPESAKRNLRDFSEQLMQRTY